MTWVHVSYIMASRCLPTRMFRIYGLHKCHIKEYAALQFEPMKPIIVICCVGASCAFCAYGLSITMTTKPPNLRSGYVYFGCGQRKLMMLVEGSSSPSYYSMSIFAHNHIHKSPQSWANKSNSVSWKPNNICFGLDRSRAHFYAWNKNKWTYALIRRKVCDVNVMWEKENEWACLLHCDWVIMGWWTYFPIGLFKMMLVAMRSCRRLQRTEWELNTYLQSQAHLLFLIKCARKYAVAHTITMILMQKFV